LWHHVASFSAAGCSESLIGVTAVGADMGKDEGGYAARVGQGFMHASVEDELNSGGAHMQPEGVKLNYARDAGANPIRRRPEAYSRISYISN